VEDLDRPRPEHEDAEGGADDDGEAADPDEEAGAPEVRRVGARVRLQSARAGQRARERDPALRIGARDGYGVCGSFAVRIGAPGRRRTLEAQCRRGFGLRLLTRELVREQGEREAAPRKVLVGSQQMQSHFDGGEPLRAFCELCERRCEGCAPLWGVEHDRQVEPGVLELL
jgi:hypothetical protein